MRKSIEGSQLPNARTRFFNSNGTPARLALTPRPNKLCRSAVSVGGRFRLVTGTTALAMLAALPVARTAAAPQFHAVASREPSTGKSINSSAEVTVRIWSLSPPAALRAVPADAAARIRLCDSCRWDRPSAPLEVRAAGDQTRLAAATGANSVTGAAELSGAWRLEPPAGGAAQSVSRATISASGGHLQVTLGFSMEEYVARVLAAEARGVASPESLKAMAVAVRTYAVRFRARHHAQSYDFCDSTHCQSLRLSGAADRYLAAAAATAGEVLTYHEKPATTYYHRDCGGTTEAAGIAWRDVDTPYLTQQPDPYCTRLGHKGWSTEVEQADLGRALIAAGIHPPPGWHGIEVVTRTPSGRARKLRLVGVGSNLLIAAPALRLAVAHAMGGNKVRSDLFAVRAEGSGYVFDGVGSGHGVGMCQDGAAEMGTEGKTYGDILAFYYPGTALRAPARNASRVSGN